MQPMKIFTLPTRQPRGPKVKIPDPPPYGYSLRATVCDIAGHLCVEDQTGDAMNLPEEAKQHLKDGDQGTLVWTKGENGNPDAWVFESDPHR